MTKCMSRLLSFAVLTAFAASVWGQSLPTSAVMQFGNQGTGSPFPPPLGHDQSIHGADKLVPRTVTIAVGGTVTLLLSNPVHAAAIYVPGTEPADINLGAIAFFGDCPPAPYINDPNGRLAQFAPICGGGNAANQFQFNAPGRYLVICTFLPHLVEADMFGWVIVGEGKSEVF